jgi:hypothetical protein
MSQRTKQPTGAGPQMRAERKTRAPKPAPDDTKMTLSVKGGEPVEVTTDSLRRATEMLASGGLPATESGPFGLQLTTFNCRVVGVKAPPIKSEGVPVGQETALVLQLNVRPTECGDIVRNALFEFKDGEWKRREDVKSVTFRKLDNQFDVRINCGGSTLLLEPKGMRLTDGSSEDGEMFGPEAHLVVELLGLPRSYAAGFNAAYDWYRPAYQCTFEPRLKVAAAEGDDDQTTLEEHIEPEDSFDADPDTPGEE